MVHSLSLHLVANLIFVSNQNAFKSHFFCMVFIVESKSSECRGYRAELRVFIKNVIFTAIFVRRNDAALVGVVKTSKL